MTMQEYMTMSTQAALAFKRRDFRGAADLYWSAFRKSPSLWAENRFIIFTGYSSILLENYFKASDHDLNSLKKVLRDKHELTLYRVEAGYSLGVLHRDRDDREAAADYYRQAIALADGAKEAELRKNVTDGMMQEKTVRELVNAQRKLCTDNLATLENPLSSFTSTSERQGPQLRSDGSYYVTSKFMQKPLNNSEILRRTAVGGNECDVCHKTLSELGVATLECCGKCKSAYYCGLACQRSAWKAGHKEACRRPDERRPGDMMRLMGLEARPELNGRLVTIVAPQPNNRWQVKLYPEESVIFVSTTKLLHLRPGK
jgi:tetratricopeptide (TPR) repeat protein